MALNSTEEPTSPRSSFDTPPHSPVSNSSSSGGRSSSVPSSPSLKPQELQDLKYPTLLDSDFVLLFNSTPGLYLILLPNPPKFTIVAVNDAYIEATLTSREYLIGKGIFEAFPDNPNDKSATGEHNLRYSLEEVSRNGKTDAMPVQKYSVQLPSGEYEARYWSPMNIPLMRKGKIKYILHRVANVTDFMNLKSEKSIEQEKSLNLQVQAESLQGEILNHMKDVENSQGRYRTLTNIIPVGIFNTDEKGEMTYTNNKWSTITNKIFHTLEHRHWLTIIPDTDIKRVTELWEKCF